MKFETARTIVKAFLVGAGALCLLALITGSGSSTGTYLTMAALACLILCVFFALTCVKCPYCGSRIFRKLLVVKVCPHCHRDLVSGTKVKGRKGR